MNKICEVCMEPVIPSYKLCHCCISRFLQRIETELKNADLLGRPLNDETTSCIKHCIKTAQDNFQRDTGVRPEDPSLVSEAFGGKWSVVI